MSSVAVGGVIIVVGGGGGEDVDELSVSTRSLDKNPDSPWNFLAETELSSWVINTWNPFWALLLGMIAV